jgi:xanthine/CO dehydrogenase XdhC/CoxF family maturation factor
VNPLGTKMAINDRGEISGSVSGGGVEGAVVEIAERVIGSGHPELAHFGNRRLRGLGSRSAVRRRDRRVAISGAALQTGNAESAAIRIFASPGMPNDCIRLLARAHRVSA